MQNNKKPVRSAVLPAERTQALSHLTRLTQNLSMLADRESQALAQDDMTTFSILQDEKEMLTERYAQASREFLTRLEEFRGIDPALLYRLETLQKELGEKSVHNNQIVSRMYQRARKNTQETLITAQELGQSRPLHIPEQENMKTQQRTEGV